MGSVAVWSGRNVFVRCVLIFLAFPGTFWSFSQGVDPAPVEVSIRCEDHQLHGRFYVNTSKDAVPTVILLHGFPGRDGDVLGLGQQLSRGAAHVLTFNYSGSYRSEGFFTLDNTLRDVRAVYDYIRQADVVARFRIDTSRIILGGYSYGGGMALTYAASHPQIRRIFSVAGNDHGEFAREYTRNAELARMMDSSFDNLMAPRGSIRFTGRQALKDLAARPEPYDLRLSAPRLADRDILLIGGWDDRQVPVETILVPLYRALKAAHAPAIRMVMLPTDHSFRNVRDDLAAEIIRWIQADPPRSKAADQP